MAHFNLILIIWSFVIIFINIVDSNSTAKSDVGLQRNIKSVNNDGQKSITNQQLDSVFKNFQINKNQIIKTHDSRALGAKYLNETELSSNEDCLLWCWNTSNCNLAVFEEKTRGSCYLFDCGTIQDFKCRFASHTFYTSSILQINRNSYLLNEWKTQASQENDLVGLKEKQTARLDNGGYGTIKTSSNDIATTSSSHQSASDQQQQQPVVNKLETTTSLTKVSKCRHYQFECRNNSECIAIYNVCDGIQQCSDGSDEADELECHKSRLNLNGNKNYLDNNGDNGARILSSSSDINSIEKNLLKAQQQQSNNRITSGNYLSSMSSSSNFGYNNNNYNKDNGPIIMNSSPQQQLKAIKFSNNLNLNYPKSPNDKILDDNGSGLSASYQSHNQMNNGGTGGDYNGYFSNWNQYSLVDNKQMDNNKPSLSILAGNGIEPDPQQPSYNTPMKESLYWPSFKYQQPNVVENYMQNHDAVASNPSSYSVPGSIQNDAIRSKMDYSSSPQQQQTSFLSQYKQISHEPTLLNVVLKPNSELARLRNNVSNLMNEQKPLPKTTITSSAVANNTNHYSHMSVSNQERIMLKNPNIVAISYLHDSVTQNGRETNSAVIALTLGLFITCILIVIVGCRMKSFKKRIARRGRSLTHDADYLINGMYL